MYSSSTLDRLLYQGTQCLLNALYKFWLSRRIQKWIKQGKTNVIESGMKVLNINLPIIYEWIIILTSTSNLSYPLRVCLSLELIYCIWWVTSWFVLRASLGPQDKTDRSLCHLWKGCSIDWVDFFLIKTIDLAKHIVDWTNFIDLDIDWGMMIVLLIIVIVAEMI